MLRAANKHYVVEMQIGVQERHWGLGKAFIRPCLRCLDSFEKSAARGVDPVTESPEKQLAP
jgi:hypothetical protein